LRIALYEAQFPPEELVVSFRCGRRTAGFIKQGIGK
jgi:hypothetical protein